jgi:hypothetical protein
LAGTFPKFLLNLSEKRQVPLSRFSKEFCVLYINPRKALPNRKRGITLFCLQKSFVNSKAFGVKPKILWDVNLAVNEKWFFSLGKFIPPNEVYILSICFPANNFFLIFSVNIFSLLIYSSKVGKNLFP